MTATPRCEKCWTSTPGDRCYCWDGVVQDGDDECPHCEALKTLSTSLPAETLDLIGHLNATKDDATADLRAELDAARKEIERLRESRDRWEAAAKAADRFADYWWGQTARGDR